MPTFWHISFIHSTHTYAGSKLYKIHLVTSLLLQTKEERRKNQVKINFRMEGEMIKNIEKFYRLLTSIFVALQLHIQIQKNSFIHSTNTKKLLRSRQC